MISIFAVVLLVNFGILYGISLLINRKVSRSIEQSEARIMTSIAQRETRLAASFKNTETEQKVTDG